MINRALELAREHSTSFEFAMLQGVRDPLKRELVAQGHRVSEYIPYGPNWLPDLSRRLRERPKNIVTMVRSFLESSAPFSRPPAFGRRGPTRLPSNDAPRRGSLSAPRLGADDDALRGPDIDRALAKHDRDERAPRIRGIARPGRPGYARPPRRRFGGGH